MIIQSLSDHGNRKRGVVLIVPDSGDEIYKHMYDVYII